MPLDAAIGPVFAPYHPGGRDGHRFRRNKLSCGVVKSLFEALTTLNTMYVAQIMMMQQ